MEVKKLFRIAAIFIAIAVAQQLHGQNNLPKYEFTLNGFGGISTLNYKVSGADLKKDFGGGGGLGFHYFFNSRWSLVTGVDAALYRASLSAATVKSGQLFNINDGVNPPWSFVADFDMNGFKESQNAWMLQIPLMIQWMHPIDIKGNNHLFIALGGRVGLPFSGDYHQSAQDRSYARITDQEVWTPTTIQRQLARGFDRKESLKFASLNAIASMEAGIRWSLGGNAGLYTGVYIDYGLSNVIPSKSDGALYTPVLGANYGMAGDFNTNSILAARLPDYGEIYTPGPGMNPVVNWVQNNAGYTDKVNTLAAGLKIKIAFGGPKKPKTIVPVAPTVVERIPEKVVEPTPPIVEAPVIVREPEVVEVPQEIRQSMMKLSNTLFEFDKWNLTSEAVIELDKVVKWLNDNPAIHVEIEGHTDSMGQSDYNQRLSEDRAKSVYGYFVEHGVSASRLSYRGYGLTNPIADNTTAEGRQQNRRVELKIITQ